MESPRACLRRRSAAIRASRTACIGRPRDISHGARLAIWWRRRQQEGRQIGTDRGRPSPFHGYYFKILTAQGAAAAGGAKPYIVNGEMSAGFALVAWPAQYDATGVMTFIVNQDGIVHEKDLGAETDATVAAMTPTIPTLPGDVSSRFTLEDDSSSSPPAICLLSNGRYSVLLTAAGSGYSSVDGMDVTRWREDATRDCWGQYCYVRDLDDGRVWSAGRQPLGPEGR